jgi:hypothetical protein
MSSYINKLFPYFVILISAIVLLGANPFKGETVAPTDLLVSQYGWRSLNLSHSVRHPVRSDILDARLPRWLHAKESLRKGNLPTWNPYPINGTPGIQWVAAAIISPAFAVFSIIEDNASGYYFAMLTNLVIAAIGAYLLLLTLTGNRLASLFGFMVFAYSGYHAAWFYWAHVTTSIWIPWLLLFAYKYLSTRQKRYLPWFSITSALMIFGGFPSIVIYTFFTLILFLAVYAPWSTGAREVFQRSLHLLLFGGLGVLITFFSLFSLYETLHFTQSMSGRHGGSPLYIYDLKRFYKPIPNNYGDVERTFYVGLLPLILVIFSVPLMLQKLDKKNVIFSFLLLAITIGFVFNIVPQKYVEIIPGFSTNNWGRMSILLPLGFALLSADTISRLCKLNVSIQKTYIIPFLIMILITIQFIDQKKIFNHFNGPVNSETFFPITPIIDHVQNALLPLQSVVADNSYLISGVLANYQIPEWLAHGFKKQTEIIELQKVVSENAFKTATATSLYCNDINFDVKKLTQLGIRYLLCKNTLVNGSMLHTVVSTSGEERFPSQPIEPNQPLIQYFDLREPVTFNVVSLYLATHNEPFSHADVTIKLYSNNILKGEATVAASQIKDNSRVDFMFDYSVVLDKINNRLEISVDPVAPTGKLSAWLHPINSPNIFITQGNDTQKAVLATKISKKSPLPEQLAYHNIEPGMLLMENVNVKGSGYMLEQLDSSEDPDFSNIALTENSHTSYSLHYTGHRPGWLILPIRNYPGWQAYIGEKAVDHQLFLDLMPAIPVKPGDQISYRYQPKMQMMVTYISLAFLLITIYLCIRLRRH